MKQQIPSSLLGRCAAALDNHADAVGARTDFTGLYKVTNDFLRTMTPKKALVFAAELLGTATVIVGAASLPYLAGVIKDSVKHPASPAPIKAPAVPGHHR